MAGVEMEPPAKLSISRQLMQSIARFCEQAAAHLDVVIDRGHQPKVQNGQAAIGRADQVAGVGVWWGVGEDASGINKTLATAFMDCNPQPSTAPAHNRHTMCPGANQASPLPSNHLQREQQLLTRMEEAGVKQLLQVADNAHLHMHAKHSKKCSLH